MRSALLGLARASVRRTVEPRLRHAALLALAGLLAMIALGFALACVTAAIAAGYGIVAALAIVALVCLAGAAALRWFAVRSTERRRTIDAAAVLEAERERQAMLRALASSAVVTLMGASRRARVLVPVAAAAAMLVLARRGGGSARV